MQEEHDCITETSGNKIEERVTAEGNSSRDGACKGMEEVQSGVGERNRAPRGALNMGLEAIFPRRNIKMCPRPWSTIRGKLRAMSSIHCLHNYLFEIMASGC